MNIFWFLSDQVEPDCSLDPARGSCKASMNQWYFDKDANTCKQFTYGGCAGNKNRYDSKEECLSNCGHPGELKLH